MIALYVLVGICLFLPFATVSCDEASTTFTGSQLVTQTVPQGGVLHKEKCSGELSDCVERNSSPKMTVALLAAALGSLLLAFGVARGPGWCAAVGFGAMLSLLGPGFDLQGPDVRYHWGCGAMLLLFLVVWIGSGVRSSRLRKDGLGESAIAVPERPSIVARAVVCVFWIDLCAALLAGYDFGVTSRFALALFIALLVVVSIFVGRLIRELVRSRRLEDAPSGRFPSLQG
jgi:hypothetical protein